MDNLKKYILPVLILLFYVLEGVSKYYLISSTIKIDVTRYLRLFIFIFILIYLLYNRKYKFFIVPVVLFLFFLIGHYFMSFSYLSFDIIIVFAKYLFVLFILEFSYNFFKKENNELFFKAFETIIILNSVIIVFGIVFNIRFLETYSGERFGYDGLFITSATATYFYMIALFYIFYSFLKHRKIHKLSILVVIPALVVGTKSIYLFIALLFIFYLLYQKPQKNRIKNLFFLVFVLSVLFVILLIIIPSFLEISKTNGLLSAILSYRNSLFIDKTLPFIQKNWSNVNYFIGGLGIFKYRTQMGFVDLYIFFGGLGFLVYLWAYYKAMFKEKIDQNSLFIMISFGIVIFLGGNFFYSATITFYLIILQQTLYKFSDKSISKHKND